MGQRFRLKAGFDISPYPADVQVILRALKKYGMILADNGSAWYISGEPDARWNNDNLALMRNITGAAFEAVDVSPLMIDPNSGQARQPGVSVTVTPSTAVVVTQTNRQFSATVQNAADQSVTWSVNGIAGGNTQVGYIDASGLYSAPSAVPNPATVTVSAASVAVPAAVRLGGGDDPVSRPRHFVRVSEPAGRRRHHPHRQWQRVPDRRGGQTQRRGSGHHLRLNGPANRLRLHLGSWEPPCR